MVGVTGIEPVTPTMSTLLPCPNTVEFRELGTTQNCIWRRFRHYVLFVFRIAGSANL